MPRDKNFKIEINKIVTKKTSLKEIKIGDVFEREGSLHMRTRVNDSNEEYLIWVVNLNTGNTWRTDANQSVIVVNNVLIKYDKEV